MILKTKNLNVSTKDNLDILHNINLNVNEGEVVVIMGPNGSGKSTLANILMGNPKYEITDGEIIFNGKNINNLSPSERAKLGIFLSFQYPQEIEGVTISKSCFLTTSPDLVVVISASSLKN